MEEGLGASEGFPRPRFMATDGKVVVDTTDNTETNHQSWFKAGAKTQPTWRKMIFILLYQELKRVPTIEEIRDYQINRLGRIKSDHAILELMPLPAKSIKKADWIYQDILLIGLTNRAEYIASYLPERVRGLKALIEKHQPKLVIFYSRTYLPYWQLIVPSELKEVIPGKMHIAKIAHITYAVTAHPVSRGITKQDWEKIAKKLLM